MRLPCYPQISTSHDQVTDLHGDSEGGPTIKDFAGIFGTQNGVFSPLSSSVQKRIEKLRSDSASSPPSHNTRWASQSTPSDGQAEDFLNEADSGATFQVESFSRTRVY